MSEKNMVESGSRGKTVVSECLRCGKKFNAVLGKFTMAAPCICPNCKDKRHKTDIAKIEIKVTWKGETMRRTREEEWWGKLSTEEILNEVELAIDRIDEVSE